MALYPSRFSSLSGAMNSCSPSTTSPSSENDGGASGCVICLEAMETNLAALPCGHVFHHNCAKQAIASCRACPVCRRKASVTSAVRLYLALNRGDVSRCNSDYSLCCSNNSSRNKPASRLSERLHEMRRELDRVSHIQRMTSSHSFRLQNELVRRQQQLEQSTRQMQQMQRELDRTNAQLKRLQQIAVTSYAQSSAAKAAKSDLETRVRSTAERMLYKIRERQQTRCQSCAKQWVEMKCVAQEFAGATAGPPRATCCRRHPAAARSGGAAAPWSRQSPPPCHHHRDQPPCAF